MNDIRTTDQISNFLKAFDNSDVVITSTNNEIQISIRLNDCIYPFLSIGNNLIYSDVDDLEDFVVRHGHLPSEIEDLISAMKSLKEHEENGTFYFTPSLILDNPDLILDALTKTLSILYE